MVSSCYVCIAHCTPGSRCGWSSNIESPLHNRSPRGCSRTPEGPAGWLHGVCRARRAFRHIRSWPLWARSKNVDCAGSPGPSFVPPLRLQALDEWLTIPATFNREPESKVQSGIPPCTEQDLILCPAQSFHSSCEKVCQAVEYVVEWGAATAPTRSDSAHWRGRDPVWTRPQLSHPGLSDRGGLRRILFDGTPSTPSGRCAARGLLSHSCNEREPPDASGHERHGTRWYDHAFARLRHGNGTPPPGTCALRSRSPNGTFGGSPLSLCPKTSAVTRAPGTGKVRPMRRGGVRATSVCCDRTSGGASARSAGRVVPGELDQATAAGSWPGWLLGRKRRTTHDPG